MVAVGPAVDLRRSSPGALIFRDRLVSLEDANLGVRLDPVVLTCLPLNLTVDADEMA